MNIIKYPNRETWNELLQRPLTSSSVIMNSCICDVLQEIKKNGDKAIIKFNELYDNIKLENITVSQAEINRANKNVSNELKKVINDSMNSIVKFHKHMMKETLAIETNPGVKCWQKSVAIEKVGIYIPGGDAPLFSTVLMHVIPAKLAGCKEIIICTPPDENGRINPKILYTAGLLGIKKIFKIAGIQAIGAMAFGTETVPKVLKIFGHGNKFVNIAKQLVLNMDVAVDMPVGPSELAIIADETSNPAFIAADILAQAEYDEESQILLATTYEPIIEKVAAEIKEQIKKIPRRKIAAKSLSNSKIFLLKTDEDVLDLINQYAPEELIINIKNYRKFADKIMNAGSVFMGQYSPESAGDYATGPNNTLPTKGSAKVFSGLSVDSFMKKITFQELTLAGLINVSETIEKMAEAEKLLAHKFAVTIRLKGLKKS